MPLVVAKRLEAGARKTKRRKTMKRLQLKRFMVISLPNVLLLDGVREDLPSTRRVVSNIIGMLSVGLRTLIHSFNYNINCFRNGQCRCQYYEKNK